MRERRTARVILLDPAGRILLMKGRLPSDPDAPGLWFTIGGGLEPGESLEAAARREILEETGFAQVSLGPPLFSREQIHRDRKNRPVRILETFLVGRVTAAEPSRAGWQALETEFVDDMRWWRLEDLAACGDGVYPPDLVERVAAVLGSGG